MESILGAAEVLSPKIMAALIYPFKETLPHEAAFRAHGSEGFWADKILANTPTRALDQAPA
jgi:hypothetical protein